MRRRRRRWLAVAAALAVPAAGWFGLNISLTRYLQSESFREAASRALRNALDAEGEWRGLRWNGLTAHGGEFRARGTVESPVREIRLTGASAVLEPRALWDGVWKMVNCRIDAIDLDFSPGDRLPPQEDDPARGLTPPARWYHRFVPHRLDLGTIEVDHAAFRWDDGSGGFTGSGFRLFARQSPDRIDVKVSATGGMVRSPLVAGDIRVSDLAATVTPSEFRLESLEGTWNGGRMDARGTFGFRPEPDFRMVVALDDVPLSCWLPETWWQRCRGSTRVEATLTGNMNERSALRAYGNVRIANGVLEGLPALRMIARKTANPEFLRLATGEAFGTFDRSREGSWRIRELRIDAPGLLRILGGILLAPDGSLQGSLLAGIPPGTLRYLAGAESAVFLPPQHLPPELRALLTDADHALLWTPVRISGTLTDPAEDLSSRLADAWFHATVEEALRLSGDVAIEAAAAAAAAARAAGAAGETVLEAAPEAIRTGVDAGWKVLDSLIRGQER